MDSKGFVLGIPGCSGFQASYIRAMAQFGLCIAAYEFVVLGFLQKHFMLFGGSLVSKRDLAEQTSG